MARPSDYSAELAAEICGRLACGEPLVRICKADEMPHVSTVYRWLAVNAEFRDMYARAREDQADTLADQIVHIADGESVQTNAEGGATEADVQRDRLRVDARKWVAAKLKPRKYGERLSQEISGPDGGPVQTVSRIERVIADPKASNP